MKEFIYNLEELFVSDGLLETLSATNYYIGAYQRGYKWKSNAAHDQVPLFLTDVYEAFIDNQEEYYLQYITIKRNDECKDLLEVIDGQQRLTTISILFYCFEKAFGFYNITKDIVQYERYNNRRIFEEIILMDEENDEGNVILKKKQDIFYLYHAKKCILNFLELLDKVEAEAFYNYYRQKVKIIINLEDDTTAAEEIFSNLNDNKVELNNLYLIKGLLFTKSTRKDNDDDNFIHIQEKRNRIARNWDDMDNWLRSEQQNQLFFYNYKLVNSKEGFLGLNPLLNALKPIVKECNDERLDKINKFYDNLSIAKEQSDTYKLFNLYNEGLQNFEEANIQLDKIYLTSKRLRNWFKNNELYNLLGFFTCTGGNIDNILSLGVSDLKEKLYQHLYNQLFIKNKKIQDLVYNVPKDKSKLDKIFLALNVFPLVKIKDSKGFDIHVIDWSNRFDFHTYRNNKWSIEHIYPQNPDATEEDVSKYKEWFIEKSSDLPELNQKIKHNILLTDEEIKTIVSHDVSEHQLGNLALLEGGNNSTLKNYIFPKKRELLLGLMSMGSFVPTHTVNAVAKLLHNLSDERLTFSKNLTFWEKEDIEANAIWIKNTYNALIEFVNENR
ncbi:DUF262 domain-containing protein [Empedobacter sp. GD03739]|uniref:DUF262 domain-containing protein n=1 Tax=Empedobacter sp. GD03739 TaxID=2975376 RepID=UPI0024475821|nr:DUF262 domain-containing protein [Empedobacter sp. GD03739]MDH1603901.1 DUF262 domain-containing HNH endonuclease family protein [Empedobacter sp. GD03739]